MQIPVKQPHAPDTVADTKNEGKLSMKKAIKIINSFADANRRFAVLLSRQDNAERYARQRLADIIQALEDLPLLATLPWFKRIHATAIEIGDILAGKKTPPMENDTATRRTVEPATGNPGPSAVSQSPIPGTFIPTKPETADGKIK